MARWFREALIYYCRDRDASWKGANDGKDHGDIDIAIATDHLCTAATDAGLGTCWVCNFDANLCRELFDMPKNLEPAVIIPVGYPADADVFATTPKKRKAINEIIKWESL
ncbi:MAG: nitroreductase family protein [Barnesiella sp.]